MGTQDPRYYENAIEAYQRVLAPSNHATITARSQAEVGWSKVLEAQAQMPSRTALEKAELLKAALNHCLNVFEGKVLGPKEELDPFWVKEAGFAAATLAEEDQQWEIAFNIYKRMRELFPVYRSALEKRMEKARAQQGPENQN
jgi:hypothetical protein